MTENREKRNPLIPLMNEGLGELMCRRHFFIYCVVLLIYKMFCEDVSIHSWSRPRPISIADQGKDVIYKAISPW